MVNLRYHIVSITAVFLALGIGILMGSTVVDKGTVSFLERRLNDVERDVSRTDDRNRELRAEIEALSAERDALSQEGLETLVAGRLQQRSVVLIAARGLDGRAVGAVRDDVERAGGSVATTIWLTERLTLSSATDAEELVRALDLRDELAADVERLRSEAASRLAAMLYPTGESGARRTARLEFDQLARSGFIDLERTDREIVLGPRSGSRGPVYVLVSGQDAAGVDAVLWNVVQAWGDAALRPRVVAADLTADDSDGSVASPPLVAAVRDDDEVRAWVSTVDHAESLAGRLAVVITAQVLFRDATGGHFGSGKGAQRVLPSPERLR